jgi:hypothetical protein
VIFKLMIHPTLVENKNVEDTGETFLALTNRSPPTPSFLLSTKVGFTKISVVPVSDLVNIGENIIQIQTARTSPLNAKLKKLSSLRLQELFLSMA